MKLMKLMIKEQLTIILVLGLPIISAALIVFVSMWWALLLCVPFMLWVKFFEGEAESIITGIIWVGFITFFGLIAFTLVQTPMTTTTQTSKLVPISYIGDGVIVVKNATIKDKEIYWKCKAKQCSELNEITYTKVIKFSHYEPKTEIVYSVKE